MAGSLAVELAEILDVVERNGGRGEDFARGTYFAHARQMEKRIKKHGRVAIREHKAVAVRPMRILRVVAQKLLPEAVGDRSESHGSSRMAGVRFLHGIHGERANCVDTQLIELFSGDYRLVTDRHPRAPWMQRALRSVI